MPKWCSIDCRGNKLFAIVPPLDARSRYVSASPAAGPGRASWLKSRWTRASKRLAENLERRDVLVHKSSRLPWQEHRRVRGCSRKSKSEGNPPRGLVVGGTLSTSS